MFRVQLSTEDIEEQSSESQQNEKSPSMPLDPDCGKGRLSKLTESNIRKPRFMPLKSSKVR